MSYDGVQYFVFAPLPSDAAPATYAAALIRHAATRYGRGAPTNGPWIGYHFGLGETHPVFLSMLDTVISAPWQILVAEPTSEIRVLAAADVGKLLAKCAIMSKRVAPLAAALAGAIENGEYHVEGVREILGDAARLLDHREANRDPLRLAQVFAALVRGLQAAKTEAASLIAVHQIED